MAGAQNKGLSVAERRRLREEERRSREAGKMSVVGGPEVAVSELAHNPRNAREALEEIEGLAETYDLVGVLQPVAVVPADTFRAAFPENQEEIGQARYVVIGGNRRLAAARLASLPTLPVLVNTKAESRKDILIAAATENLAREELKPLEELRTIEELKQELGTYDAVAKQLGKTPGWVSQRRRLHSLQPEVREALEEGVGGMTIELARDLGKIKDREQQLKAWDAERALAAERAAEPKIKKPRQKQQATGDKSIPSQGKPVDSLNGEAAGARRTACAAAVAAVQEDVARVQILALRAPGSPDEAVTLASCWLTEAGADPEILHTSAPASNDHLQQQAVLALSLAHCELHMAHLGSADSVHSQAYLDWLAAHIDYQPTDEAKHAVTA